MEKIINVKANIKNECRQKFFSGINFNKIISFIIPVFLIWNDKMLYA